MRATNSESRIAILGGDQRQIYAAKRLVSEGLSVCTWGLGASADLPCVTSYSEWRDAVNAAPYLVLPLPATSDGVHLHSPLSKGGSELRLDVLFDAAEGKTLLGGRLSEAFVRLAEKRNIQCIDYFTSEVLQRKNALPTVEGAIEIAMQRLPVTIAQTETAIIGYGRLGELLAYKLVALGARVTVFARREESLCRAQLFGCKTVRLEENDSEGSLCCVSPDTRVIFHTVPVCLFTERVLKRIPRGILHIDLSSAPGGIDRVAAQSLGIQSVLASSLPGKYAPETAGEIIADTVKMILEERLEDFEDHRKDSR